MTIIFISLLYILFGIILIPLELLDLIFSYSIKLKIE